MVDLLGKSVLNHLPSSTDRQQVITNVSTAFYNIDTEPGFFRWGYAWPLHYVVEGSRQILFDLRNTLGLDFGVLIVWGAINTAVFPFACYFMRWKSKNGVNEYYK